MRTLGMIALGVAIHGACGLPPDSTPDDDIEHPANAEELFASDVVWNIDLYLAPDAIEALDEEPSEYVQGRARIGEVWIEQVSVRLKGNYSFSSLAGKASFKIKVNNFTDADRIGVSRLTLNNMRQDRSQIHEWLGYRVLRELGLVAPRSGFARVSVNDLPFGLYANVETPDDRFLTANFADPTGNLYEAPWTADLDAEHVELYEQDEGDDDSREDLDRLVEQVALDDDTVFFGDDALIDSDQFLRYVAAEAVVGHWDGYWKSNNYFLYHEIESDSWTWLPWGFDMVFDRELDPFTSIGLVADKCWGLPTCVAAYSRIALQVLDELEALDLSADIDAVTTLIATAVERDPRTPHPPQKVARHWELTRDNLESAASRLRPQFDCVDDGQEADRDGDGYGACFRDCDDSSAAARPGGTEVCDGLDNDCDGSVDEAMCACTSHSVAGTTYLFCGAIMRWTDARDECIARGGELARLQSVDASERVFELAAAIDPSVSWFIGANDRTDERTWRSSLETTMGDTHFADGEPDDFGGQDCAVLASYAGGGWADEFCSFRFPYICELSP